MNKPKKGLCATNEFMELWQLFYDFNNALQYPNCEGLADEKRIIKMYEKQILSSTFYKKPV